MNKKKHQNLIKRILKETGKYVCVNCKKFVRGNKKSNLILDCICLNCAEKRLTIKDKNCII